MRELLAQIRKDTDRWESHPILEACTDDFQAAALLRGRRPGRISLLSLGNELMDLSVSLDRHAAPRAWSVTGNLIPKFSIYHDSRWPERLRKRYISVYRAAARHFDAADAALDGMEGLCADMFDLHGENDRFESGQHVTMYRGSLTFSGNAYPADLPPGMTARLFRGELALAMTCLLWPFAEFYKGMLPRPIDGEVIRPLLQAMAHDLFSVTPRLMDECRALNLGGLHGKEVESVNRRADELCYGTEENSIPSSVFDFNDERDWKTRCAAESDLERGDLDGAVAQLKRHLALYPASFHCRRKLTRIYLWFNQPLKALPELGRLADLYFERSRYGAALQVLDRMHEMAPGDPRVHLRKADVRARTGYLMTTTEELQTAGGIYLDRGDEQGLELFRKRMVRIWWGRLPSIQNMTAQQMLRLDFHDDLGFCWDRPASTGGSPFPWDDGTSWRTTPLSPPVPFDEFWAIDALKRMTRIYEEKGETGKQADAAEKLAQVYARNDLDRRALAVYERLKTIRPDRTPLYMQQIAEMHLRHGRQEEGLAVLGELEHYYRRQGRPDKAALVADTASELVGGKKTEDEFSFDFGAPAFDTNLRLCFETDPVLGGCGNG